MDSILSGIPQGANFEIVKLLTIPVTKAANNTQGVATVSHGLDYKPAYLAFFTTNAAATIYYSAPYFHVNTTSGIINFKADIVTDEDTVNCYIITPSAGAYYATAYNNAKFYVYLLRQPIYA